MAIRQPTARSDNNLSRWTTAERTKIGQGNRSHREPGPGHYLTGSLTLRAKANIFPPSVGGRSSAWLEPQIVDLAVAGSNPVGHPIVSMAPELPLAQIGYRNGKPFDQVGVVG